MNQKNLRISTLLIVILCTFLYGNSLNNGYALDDEYVIVNQDKVEKGIQGIPEIFTSRYVNIDEQNHGYRPVTLTTFALEYQFFEANPKISHGINLILYILTCVVLLRLLLRLFDKQHWALAALTTFIFLIHPIHTEVVNNVKSRDELLCFLFAISALFQFIKYIDRKRLQSIVLGCLFFALSILSKPSSLTFVAIIPLALWFFTEIKLKKLLFFTGGVILLLISIRFAASSMVSSAAQTSRDIMFYENPMIHAYTHFYERIPMAFYSVGYYFGLLLFPINLIAYYGFDQVPIAGWENPFFGGSGILIVAIFIYAVSKMKSKPIWVFGLLYFLTTISMFSNFAKPVVGIVAERFAYLPSLGFCILIAVVLTTIFKMKPNKDKFEIASKPLFLGALGLIFILCSGKIISRNQDWKDSTTLLRADVQRAENSAKLNEMLANKLLIQAQNESSPNFRIELAKESMFHFNKAVEIYPDYSTAWNNMGALYINILRDPAKAKPCFERAIEINPDYTVALFSLGYCHERDKEYDKAMKCYQKVIDLSPTDIQAKDQLKKVKELLKVEKST